ncbi:MAG: M23 family metallopeptidase [Candidatus Doudnabacteria bacterium]|nr:M23 family metallopeptidase [Candidatus Doudnabacteria bacterium]
MKKIIFIFILVGLAAGCQKTPATNVQSNNQNASTTTNTPASPAPATTAKLSMPIANGLGRITKKPFGIYITPQNSPVSPEKFKGYHTGTDFETTVEEQDADVAISAACDGELLLKKYATGYGGVMVQSCVLNGENVTVLYGHLKLASITLKVGDSIVAGQNLGILGKGYSTETDGERKHLHLSIHKGTGVVLLGYTQNKADLSSWLNAEDYLK